MFDRGILDAIKAHAIASYPQESCGIVTAAGYEPLPNVAVDPEGRVPDGEWRRHNFLADGFKERLVAGEVLALVHSHPDGPEWPSIPDQAQQIAMDLPWGLVICNDEVAGEPFFWSDDLTPPPLLGRDFRTGPSGSDGRGDCGALVRDWYRIERCVLLPDCPRDADWFKRGGNLYMEHYAACGFRPAPMEAPELGDVVLMQIRAPVPNHAAVYIGDGLVLHHLEGRLSRVEPLGPWLKYVVNWMRRHAV